MTARSVRLGSILLTIALLGALMASTPARAAGCTAASTTVTPNQGGGYNHLEGVDALSKCGAWAVGWYDSGGNIPHTLIERWNGTQWKIKSSPNSGTSDSLFGVTAISAKNAWAVGNADDDPLILHWNGIKWTQQAAPNPGVIGQLQDVVATSPTNAWAVGYWIQSMSSPVRTLILHWNGTSWTKQTAPAMGSSYTSLEAVDASSASNAVAVGSYRSTQAARTLVLRWNGTSWKKQLSYNSDASTDNYLEGVSVLSASTAWAVGYVLGSKALILQWTGTRWAGGGSPVSSYEHRLYGVAAVSSKEAWAVGWIHRGGHDQTLALHYSRSRWRKSPTPNLSTLDNHLLDVDATSASDLWAVGFYNDGSREVTLAIHCC